MKRTIRARLVIACLSITGTLFAAQQSVAEVIELQQGDLQRLGIRFAPVKLVGHSDGFRVPAVVTHSPDNRSAISSRFAAVLKQWHAAGGDRVELGQPVVTLTSSELMQSQQQWLSARQTVVQMQTELTRDQQLFDEGIIARQRLQQTRRNVNQAQFDLRVWQQQLQQAGLSDTELQQLYAGKRAPGEITLRAPQAGVLSRTFVRAGDRVISDQVLASVTNDGELWVRGSANSSLVTTVQVGDALRVLEEGVPLQLMSKNLNVELQTQTVELQARFTQASNLLPGQQVTLLIGGNQSGWQVPATAVTHTDGKTYVYIRHPQGVEARELQLTPLGQGYLALTGLQNSDSLVVQGTAQLKGMQLGLGGGE